MPTPTALHLPKVTLRRPILERGRRWHTLWLVATGLCLLLACLRLWQVLDGRMYYLLDSDMSSEMVLAAQLRREHALVSPNWFYSTELHAFHIQWVLTPLFLLFDNWLVVRKIGTALWLLAMLASLFYLCYEAGIPHLFAAIGTLLVCPLSDVYFRILLLTISYPPYIMITFVGLGLALRYAKTRSKRGSAVVLAAMAVLGVLAGANGMRQLLIFYLPLLLTALCLALVRSNHTAGATLPALPRWEGRFLAAAAVSTAAAVGGYLLNSRVLRYIYHFAGQEGVHFTDFTLERLEYLLQGWLETFGYRPGVYITSADMLHNAFCFLGIAVYVLALLSLLRRPGHYTKAEQVLYLISFFALLAYTALYLFTDMVYYTRYNIPIAILMMPVAVDYLYRLPLCRVYRAGIFAVLSLLLAFCVQRYYTWLWPQNMTRAHEDAVAALRVAGYTEGYATFWNANIMVELSNGAFDIRVWEPAKDITEPDTMYEWLQTTEHFGTQPQGMVFAFFNKDETEYTTPATALTDGEIVYEDEHYIAYGYESYAALKADFAD